MKTCKLRTVLCVGALFLLTVLLAPSVQTGASAAEFELKFGALSPDNVYAAKAAKNWMTKVEKETNGRVHFTAYWGSTLISTANASAEVQQGLVDVASYSSDYARVGFDFVKGSGTFYYRVASPEAQARIFLDLRKKFPEVDGEYAKYGKLLANDQVMPTMQFMGKKPVRKLADLKGLKIKTPTAYIPLMNALGAEAVSMSMFEVYLGIQKGTIDGIMAPWDVLVPLKLDEVLKSVTIMNLTYPVLPGLLMGWNRWNSLPPDIQKVFENNMKYYSDENLSCMNEAINMGISAAKKKNIEIIELSKDDIAKIDDIVYKESLKKAAELDGKGLPGNALLTEIRRQIGVK